MKNISRALATLFLGVALSAGVAVADTSGAARYDNTIESRVNQELSKKQEFRNLQASVEDGIVTLTGDVNVYQQKLNAAKKIRKLDKVQGVRNLIAVGTTAPDSKLAADLDRKLYYDRIGYDNVFNYVTVSVNDGVATLIGDVKNPVSRDSAFSIASSVPGVKEVVDNIRVLPVSNFDDEIRLRATRAIYGNSVLSRYAIDPALPIRIVVDNGKLTLYGTVESKMDKEVAGIKASQIFGVFSVQNNLVVAKKS
jgi:hyperosmotically inducible periplasmic protein